MKTMSRSEKIVITLGTLAGVGVVTYIIARLQVLYSSTYGESIITHFIGMTGVIILLLSVYILIRIWDRWDRI